MELPGHRDEPFNYITYARNQSLNIEADFIVW